MTGSHFVGNSVVRWGTADRATMVVSSTQLTATILSGDLNVPALGYIDGVQPRPGGGASNGVPFTVTNPVPWLSHRGSLMTTQQDDDAFTLVVTGSHFVSNVGCAWAR